MHFSACPVSVFCGNRFGNRRIVTPEGLLAAEQMRNDFARVLNILHCSNGAHPVQGGGVRKFHTSAFDWDCTFVLNELLHTEACIYPEWNIDNNYYVFGDLYNLYDLAVDLKVAESKARALIEIQNGGTHSFQGI